MITDFLTSARYSGRPTDMVRSLSLYAGIASLCALVGLLLVRGKYGVALAGGLSGGLLLVLGIRFLKRRALTVWVVVGVVAYPFVRFPQQHAQLTFDRLWILGLGGAVLLTASSVQWQARASRRVATWLGLFVCAIVLRGVLTGEQQRFAIETAVNAAVLPAILFIAARRMVTGTDQWDRLAGSFAAAGAILGLMAILERVIGFHLATLSGGNVALGGDVGVRASGPYSSDDVLAVAALMCLAATLLWIQASARRRRIGVIVVALELLGIYFTYFRGAWIATLVVVVVAIGLRPRRYARLLGTMTLIAAIAAVLFVQAQGTQSLAQRLGNTQNISGRLATYIGSVELFTRHPFTGVGLDQSAIAQQNEITPVTVGGVQAASSAHSSYFGLLSEGGLLVFGPFLVLTLASWQMINRFRKVAREHHDVLIGASVAAAGLAYVLMSMEENVITSSTASNAFFAILLGACAGRLDAMHSRERESNAPGASAGGMVRRISPDLAPATGFSPLIRIRAAPSSAHKRARRRFHGA